MSATDQREQEQVIGTVSGITQKKQDTWQVAVMPDGMEYAKNLWTKDANLVQSLSGMIGVRLAFLCNASYWDRGGQQVRSLWIEAAGQPTANSPALQGPVQNAVVQPQVTPMGTIQGPGGKPMTAQALDDPKQGKIHRQTATKVSAILLSNLPQEERTMANLLVLAERLVAYYDNGLPNAESLDDLMMRAMPQGMEPTPEDPDQIPF